jgi:uncharacterized membrane protein YcjF (UPF0283 family)
VITWIAWGAVGLGVLLVVLAASAMPSRMRRLRRALRVLSWRQQDVQRLSARAEVLRGELAQLQARVASLQGDEPRSF